jgi:hypothetical protein
MSRGYAAPRSVEELDRQVPRPEAPAHARGAAEIDGPYFIASDGQFRVPSWLWDQLERDLPPALLAVIRDDLDALAAALAVTRARLRERWLRGEWRLAPAS